MNPFDATSVGSLIVVPGAGPSGAPLGTTIAAHLGGNRVELADVASTSVAGVAFVTGHDDAPAINAAITAAGAGGVVVLSAGVYLIGSTVNAGNGRVKITGGSTNYGSVFLAGVPGMTMLRSAGSAVIEDITLDGGGFAGFGLLTTWQANKLHLTRIRAQNCEAGFVFDGTQNSLTFDCMAQYNRRAGFWLANGVANGKFINCNTNMDSGATSNYAGIRLENSTDPRFNGSIAPGGMREISFMGGIHERGSDAHFQVEILDAAGYVSFTEVEFTTGNTAIHLGPGMGSAVFLNRVQFNMGASDDRAVLAEAGIVHVDGVTYGGTHGQAERTFYVMGPNAALTFAAKSADVPQNLLGASGRFRYGIGTWLPSGGGTATWDSSGPGRLAVTSTSAANGARCAFPGSGAVKAGEMARISFYVQSITGAAAINLRVIAGGSNRELNTPGTYGVGEHTVITQLDGDETGILICAPGNVSMSALIGYIGVTVF